MVLVSDRKINETEQMIFCLLKAHFELKIVSVQENQSFILTHLYEKDVRAMISDDVNHIRFLLLKSMDW